MTGRGRGRLLRNIEHPENSAATITPDIRLLFNGQRSGLEVYRILKHNLLTDELQTNKLRSLLETMIRNMILDGTNTLEICKYLYVCSCTTQRQIGNEIWNQFYNILEVKFKEIREQGDQSNEETVFNFTKFFVVAVHFMRAPTERPKTDIISAILILISRLNKSSHDDRYLYCQAIAWMSSYKEVVLAGGSILSQAYMEGVSEVREWVLDGTGGHWALACLETSCSHGILPPSSRSFYSKTLSTTHFSYLTGASANILVPAVDKNLFHLPNLDCINYID